MTIIFDPDSWDRAIADFQSCDVSEDAIRRILEAVPLTRTTYSAVDMAAHTAITPINNHLAALHHVAGERRTTEISLMQATVDDYRATEAANVIAARSAVDPL